MTSLHTGNPCRGDTRRIVVLLEAALHERVQQVAKADRRSMSNWIEVVIARALADVPAAGGGDAVGS